MKGWQFMGYSHIVKHEFECGNCGEVYKQGRKIKAWEGISLATNYGCEKCKEIRSIEYSFILEIG